jgi:hypothetical protein
MATSPIRVGEAPVVVLAIHIPLPLHHRLCLYVYDHSLESNGKHTGKQSNPLYSFINTDKLCADLTRAERPGWIYTRVYEAT